MSGLFSALAFMSLVFLVAGITMPQLFKKLFKGNATRKNVGLTFLGSTVLFLILAGAFGSSSTQPSTVSTTAKTETTQAPLIVLNLAQHIGKDIDEIRVTIGKPNGNYIEPNKQQLALGITEWDNQWEIQGLDLLVTYKVADRKVVDFFIAKGQPNTTANQDALIAITGLSRTSSAYDIKFVKAYTDPSVMTGMIVTPKN